MTEQEQDRAGLRPARVMATAIAAVTGAFFASKLGVYGTVIGVGLISLASTIGGELYVRSLDRTKEAARAKTAVLTLRQSPTAQGQPDRVTVQLERMDDTQDLPLVPTADQADWLGGNAVDADAQADQPESRWKLRWPLIAGGTVAAFMLAMLAITGIEAFTGNSFSGDKESTVGQLVSGTGSAGQPIPDEQPVDTGTDNQPAEPAPAPSEGSTPSSSPSPENEPDESQPTTPAEDDETEPPAEDETEPPDDGETDRPDEGEGDDGDAGEGDGSDEIDPGPEDSSTQDSAI